MSPCRDCGQPLAAADRFCSACGAAASMEPVLLAAAPPAPTHANPTATSQGRHRLLLALGTILIGVVGWSLISSADAGTDDDRTSTTTAPCPVRFPTTTPPVTATTDPVPSTTDLVAGVGGEAGEPLLGEPVGLSLLIGGGSDLRHLDLDTGVLTRYPVDGQPVHVAGDQLVLIDPGSGLVRAVPLANPPSASHLLAATPLLALEPSRDTDPGAIWVLTTDDPTGRSGAAPIWRLVRITDGLTQNRIPASSRSFAFDADGPMITSSPAGGVFAYDGTGYEQVADGVPVAVSDNHVLVQTCPAPAECRLGWLRRGTWAPADLPLPSEPVDQVNWLSPDGRVLSYLAGGELRFLDVDRSQPVDLHGIRPTGDHVPVAVSPDGRYLVMVASRIELYDLDAGTHHRLELNATFDDRLLLVGSGP